MPLTADMANDIAQKTGLKPTAVCLLETTMQMSCFMRKQYDEDSVTAALVKQHGISEDKAREFYRAFSETVNQQ